MRYLNSLKNNIRIKTFASITLAFIATLSISNIVFVGGSPELNARILEDIKLAPANFVAFLRNPLQRPKSYDQIMTEAIPRVAHPEGIQLAPIAKGVSASEPDGSGRRYIQIDQGTRLEVKEVTLGDGRTVTVYVPLD